LEAEAFNKQSGKKTVYCHFRYGTSVIIKYSVMVDKHFVINNFHDLNNT
jgi:hypothetical protein